MDFSFLQYSHHRTCDRQSHLSTEMTLSVLSVRTSSMPLGKVKLRLSNVDSGEKNLQMGREDWMDSLTLCLLWVTLHVEVLLPLHNCHHHTSLRGQVPLNLLTSTETKILTLDLPRTLQPRLTRAWHLGRRCSSQARGQFKANSY